MASIDVNSAARNGTYSGGLRLLSGRALRRFAQPPLHRCRRAHCDEQQWRSERQQSDAHRTPLPRLARRRPLCHEPFGSACVARDNGCGRALCGSSGFSRVTPTFRTTFARGSIVASADARLNFSLAPNVILTGGGSYETQHQRASGAGAEHRERECRLRAACGHIVRNALVHRRCARRSQQHLRRFHQLPRGRRVRASRRHSRARGDRLRVSRAHLRGKLIHPAVRRRKSGSASGALPQLGSGGRAGHRARSRIRRRDVFQSALSRHDPVQRTRRRKRSRTITISRRHRRTASR